MLDILHRIGVQGSSPDAVYDALTTIDGLAGWWATNTHREPGVDGVIEFRFVPGGFDMKVLELVPATYVLWEVVEGPEEWLGTRISWELTQEDDWTIVMFKHEGWKEPVAFMHHCSTKWATFLLSLKALLETGVGAPDPKDLSISNWH